MLTAHEEESMFRPMVFLPHSILISSRSFPPSFLPCPRSSGAISINVHGSSAQEDHTDRIAKQQQKEQHQQMQQMQHQHQQQLLMHSDGGFGTLDAFSSGALFSYPGE